MKTIQQMHKEGSLDARKYREFYEDQSRRGLSNWHIMGSHLRVKWTLEHVPVGSSVLEVGCQDGGVTRYLADKARCVTAIDVSQHYLDRAMQHLADRDNITFCRAEGTTYQSQDKYDVIVATELIEHVVDPVALIRNLMKMVRRGGSILVTTPLGWPDTEGEHINEFESADEVLDLLLQAVGNDAPQWDARAEMVDIYVCATLTKRRRARRRVKHTTG